MEISVVTAVYNGEQYLEESIESIVSQTFRNFEYIIVNDGSNDKTKEILDNLTDPRVKVIHLEKNAGAANALNIGINAARGRWIALQDADDVSSKHRLQRQLQYMNSDARLVAVGSLIRCIPGKDPVDQSALNWEEFFFNSQKIFKKNQFYNTPICHGTGFFLKRTFEKIGGYDPSFKIAYDYDLWTRMFEVGRISRVPEVLYKYRIHGDSLAHSNKFETTKEVLVSTFKNISELRFKHLKRKPKILLLGKKKHFHFYMENLEHKNHYLMMSLLGISMRGVKKACSLYLSGKIDGVMLVSNQMPAWLNSPQSKTGKFLSFFERKGLSLGKKLFVVWMPVTAIKPR